MSPYLKIAKDDRESDRLSPVNAARTWTLRCLADLDSDVKSALRRRRPGIPSGGPLDGSSQRTADLYLSVVSVGEIEKGITQQQHHDPSFAHALALWMDRVMAWYGDRVLTIDVATARRWGQLSATLGHSGADLLIAATALEHGLTVHHPQRPPLRSNWSPGNQSLRVSNNGHTSWISSTSTSPPKRALTCIPEVGNGALRATQPASLNDPFECSVTTPICLSGRKLKEN